MSMLWTPRARRHLTQITRRDIYAEELILAAHARLEVDGAAIFRPSDVRRDEIERARGEF
jgi:hypothetical protein